MISPHLHGPKGITTLAWAQGYHHTCPHLHGHLRRAQGYHHTCTGPKDITTLAQGPRISPHLHRAQGYHHTCRGPRISPHLHGPRSVMISPHLQGPKECNDITTLAWPQGSISPHLHGPKECNDITTLARGPRVSPHLHTTLARPQGV